MGNTRLMCMVKGCKNDAWYKSGYEDTFNEDNPFLCDSHGEMTYEERVKLDLEDRCQETPTKSRFCPFCGKETHFFISTPTNPLSDDLACWRCEDKFESKAPEKE